MHLKSKKSHTLTVAELPAHTHGRGTQEITGRVGLSLWDNPPDGAFYRTRNGNYHNASGVSGADEYFIDFAASRNWTGTSESIGSGTSIDIMNPYKVAYCFIRLS